MVNLIHTENLWWTGIIAKTGSLKDVKWNLIIAKPTLFSTPSIISRCIRNNTFAANHSTVRRLSVLDILVMNHHNLWYKNIGWNLFTVQLTSADWRIFYNKIGYTLAYSEIPVYEKVFFPQIFSFLPLRDLPTTPNYCYYVYLNYKQIGNGAPPKKTIRLFGFFLFYKQFRIIRAWHTLNYSETYLLCFKMTLSYFIFCNPGSY